MTASGRLRPFVLLIAVVSFLEFLNFLVGPFGMAKEKTLPDFLFLLLLLFHGLWALRILRGSTLGGAHGAARRRRLLLRALYRTPEVLFVVTAVLFLLSFIFASNANMDYVQRFAAKMGTIRLAPDSTIQRWNSVSRYVPLFLLQLTAIAFFRIRYRLNAARATTDRRLRGDRGLFAAVWGLPLTLLSALLYAFAFPSFLSTNGWGALAFIALVPLLVVFYEAPYSWSVFYGVAFGVIETMITNYWLGTFSLVSLQFVTVVTAGEFILFMMFMLVLFKRLPGIGFLIVPMAWAAFDWLKSTGFLGYPWGMIGVTQYELTPFIQIASITGVWGVSFLVTLANSVIAHTVATLAARGVTLQAKSPIAFAAPDAPAEPPARHASDRRLNLLRVAALPVLYLLLFALDVGLGSAAMGAQARRPADRVVKVALVQQNTDPRKNDYGSTFDVLKRLTNQAMAEKPDLVAWSETAFVPNIRKWSTYDPAKYPYAKLVDDLLAYQKSLNVWLLTGNDDYSEAPGPDGTVVRSDYNASVLFSPDGKRVETYHKIHLVPFTEYFPYKRQLPFVYAMLMNFDVYLWEPGTRHVVFRTPELSFSTPICFEDAFPNDVREFVLEGAQVIMNISNDYWSLTPTEGQQHFMNSLFRAIENRRPLLRATASGVTGYVDASGRLVARVPYYEPAWMVAKVPIGPEQETLYTRYGDWFPELCGMLFVILLFVAYSPRVGRGRL